MLNLRGTLEGILPSNLLNLSYRLKMNQHGSNSGAVISWVIELKQPGQLTFKERRGSFYRFWSETPSRLSLCISVTKPQQLQSSCTMNVIRFIGLSLLLKSTSYTIANEQLGFIAYTYDGQNSGKENSFSILNLMEVFLCLT